MPTTPLRVMIADDERPARRFLANVLQSCNGVEIVGEAGSGEEALAVIERTRPQLALLDLQMPGLGGLDVVRRLPPDLLPVIAFVTAFDDFAIDAFELNAIDYVLKPARKERVEATLDRTRERLARREPAAVRAEALATVAAGYDRRRYLDRIPVKRREEVVILPVRNVAFVSADGELLHLTTLANERHTITYRLHALEARLDPRRWVRLNRSTLANVTSSRG
jgi:two-component system LytT family response regulator